MDGLLILALTLLGVLATTGILMARFREPIAAILRPCKRSEPARTASAPKAKVVGTKGVRGPADGRGANKKSKVVVLSVTRDKAICTVCGTVGCKKH